jgi:hypothetical protein
MISYGNKAILITLQNVDNKMSTFKELIDKEYSVLCLSQGSSVGRKNLHGGYDA